MNDNCVNPDKIKPSWLTDELILRLCGEFYGMSPDIMAPVRVPIEKSYWKSLLETARDGMDPINIQRILIGDIRRWGISVLESTI